MGAITEFVTPLVAELRATRILGRVLSRFSWLGDVLSQMWTHAGSLVDICHAPPPRQHVSIRSYGYVGPLPGLVLWLTLRISGMMGMHQ